MVAEKKLQLNALWKGVQMPKGSPSSWRLSVEARELLAQLAQALGISQTSVLELAIRRMAKEELPAKPKASQRKKKS